MPSYVAGDKICCLYDASDEGIIREHAPGCPVDVVMESSAVIQPRTGQS